MWPGRTFISSLRSTLYHIIWGILRGKCHPQCLAVSTSTNTSYNIKSKFYNNHDRQISTFAIIGVIGGLLSLMLKVIKILGKISLIIIYKQKKEIEEIDEIEQNNSDTPNYFTLDDLNKNIIIE